MLHITNGESVVSTFRQVKFPGSYLSWIDALHDGPVPESPSLSALSDVRAGALAGFGWGNYEKIRSEFAERDRVLEAFRKHEEVVLWFEHDLFDQLQLLQLLDWFSRQDLGKVRLSLVQIDSFPGVQPFHGLGQLSGTQLARLFPARRTVSPAQLAISGEAWRAFCSPTAQALFEFVQHDHREMPYLRAALLRLCQEYPWRSDGLSRSQRQVLLAVDAGATTRQKIYLESRKLEPCPWGDASVYLRVDALAGGSEPALVQDANKTYLLTEHGKELLAGKADWIKLSGGIDTWIGGVHLAGSDAAWRWDEAGKALVKTLP